MIQPTVMLGSVELKNVAYVSGEVEFFGEAGPILLCGCGPRTCAGFWAPLRPLIMFTSLQKCSNDCVKTKVLSVAAKR
jgi:hypothetical protein